MRSINVPNHHGIFPVATAFLIERMFAGLKDFRRVATRHDKLGRNFLAGALLAAIVIWWLN
jgi:transposase